MEPGNDWESPSGIIPAPGATVMFAASLESLANTCFGPGVIASMSQFTRLALLPPNLPL